MFKSGRGESFGSTTTSQKKTIGRTLECVANEFEACENSFRKAADNLRALSEHGMTMKPLSDIRLSTQNTLQNISDRKEKRLSVVNDSLLRQEYGVEPEKSHTRKISGTDVNLIDLNEPLVEIPSSLYISENEPSKLQSATQSTRYIPVMVKNGMAYPVGPPLNFMPHSIPGALILTPEHPIKLQTIQSSSKAEKRYNFLYREPSSVDSIQHDFSKHAARLIEQANTVVLCENNVVKDSAYQKSFGKTGFNFPESKKKKSFLRVFT